MPEYKTITIPGDITGTWPVASGVGMCLVFALATGSSVIGTANAWVSSDFNGATGATNGVAATSDTFQITGVVLLPGIDAPFAARSALIMRPYDQELMTCLRYWEKGFLNMNYRSNGTPAPPTGITSAYELVKMAVPKRINPVVTFTGCQYYNTSDGQVAFTPLQGNTDTGSFTFYSTTLVNWKGWTNNNGSWAADARI
jgi:hypothetical protein